ncbi:methyl-accepting chemotaxis protein [Stigmatella aurantiaca]|uniref:Methyl-accepting chemotaxis protein n=2 Tax=Stigmatella TaxID=40 RepID=Q09DK9_STIAD|nr:CHASE3 domain-containing protein [Stigmatella aurantiaca]ADO69300.1 Methyl-accepting chemotaxis protein [Stigmatella aurantiaca DW4/3-1]EAU69813.1 methyl-accepting chemotaxis sensory transducer [Stigmatella aurantiaca DW4/3-1]
MTIGKKIVTGFGLCLLVLLAVALVAFQGAEQLVRTSDDVVTSREQARYLREVRTMLLDAETAQRGFLLTGQERYLDPYVRALPNIETDLEELKRAFQNEPQQEVRLTRLERQIREKLAELAETIRLRREQGFEAAQKVVLTDKGKLLMQDIRQTIDEMLVVGDERWVQAADSAQRNAQRSILFLSVGTLLGFIIVGLGSYVITRGITVPLGRLMSGVESFTRGNLSHRIEVHNEDETGKLARAFNAMAERRQESEAQLGRQSEQREQTLRTVAEFVNQLAGASTEILSSTSEQVASAQEQGSAVAETVSTVEEIAQTSEEAAGRARAVSESARQSEELGKGGRRAVDEAVSAMAAVREQVESIATRILALAEQAQAIGDIINTVNDISEQTHMLALNASIEASRAGEHGRGFAVVATEVKALADQSKKATAQVRQILGHIQKATHSAVMTTEEGTKSVAAATRVVGQAGASIQTLGEILAQASLTAAQIAASANQQATGIGQIRQAMRDVNQSAQQTLASTRQTERAVQDLNTMGLKLKGLLSEFGRTSQAP